MGKPKNWALDLPRIRNCSIFTQCKLVAATVARRLSRTEPYTSCAALARRLGPWARRLSAPLVGWRPGPYRNQVTGVGWAITATSGCALLPLLDQAGSWTFENSRAAPVAVAAATLLDRLVCRAFGEGSSRGRQPRRLLASRPDCGDKLGGAFGASARVARTRLRLVFLKTLALQRSISSKSTFCFQTFT